jgi:hypothetical protein
MAERVRRIKQKRREKLGLPPLEEDLQAANKEEGTILFLNYVSDPVP